MPSLVRARQNEDVPREASALWTVLAFVFVAGLLLAGWLGVTIWRMLQRRRNAKTPPKTEPEYCDLEPVLLKAPDAPEDSNTNADAATLHGSETLADVHDSASDTLRPLFLSPMPRPQQQGPKRMDTKFGRAPRSVRFRQRLSGWLSVGSRSTEPLPEYASLPPSPVLPRHRTEVALVERREPASA